LEEGANLTQSGKKGARASGVWFAGVWRETCLPLFLRLNVNGIWSDEIDGETPSMARETRAIPKTNCVVPAQSAPMPRQLAPLFGNLFWQTLSIEIDPQFLSHPLVNHQKRA